MSLSLFVLLRSKRQVRKNDKYPIKHFRHLKFDIKTMELKQKDLFLVYIVIGLAGLWLIFKVVFSPFHEKLSGLSNAMVLEEARLKKGIGLIENKDIILKEYDKYASYFSLQDSTDESAKASFLKDVEKMGRAAGLTILDMKPQKEVESDKFSKQYQINIKAEATMKEVVNFLYSLRTSSLLFGVERMVLVPKGEESQELGVTMSIVGVVFL